jgi:hypothetical protein
MAAVQAAVLAVVSKAVRVSSQLYRVWAVTQREHRPANRKEKLLQLLQQSTKLQNSARLAIVFDKTSANSAMTTCSMNT